MLYWLLSALCLGFSQASAMLCSGLVIVTKVGHPSPAPTGFSTHQCRPPQLVDSFVHHVIFLLRDDYELGFGIGDDIVSLPGWRLCHVYIKLRGVVFVFCIQNCCEVVAALDIVIVCGSELGSPGAWHNAFGTPFGKGTYRSHGRHIHQLAGRGVPRTACSARSWAWTICWACPAREAPPWPGPCF